VVDAGHGIKSRHAESVNKGAENAAEATFPQGFSKAEQQCQYTDATAHDMGHHVHDLFTFGVVREFPIPQLDSFHFVTTFLTERIAQRMVF
jgi:hypothetical protein